jgi:hypothetical protein
MAGCNRYRQLRHLLAEHSPSANQRSAVTDSTRTTTRAAISGVMTTRSRNLAANFRPREAVVKRLPWSEAHIGQTSRVPGRP